MIRTVLTDLFIMWSEFVSWIWYTPSLEYMVVKAPPPPKIDYPRSKTYGRKRSDPANFPAISGSRIPKSVPASGFWLISGKFRYPGLINVSVCRFPSGSGLRFPVSPDDDRIQARFPSDPGTYTEVTIRPFPSGFSRYNNSTNTGQSSKSTGAKLTLRYLANQ